MEENRQPLISVIIPMRNREKTIQYCLDSVLNQTYKNIEVILVDDCSSDNTIEIIKSYADKRITLIELKQSSGAQKARNEGIKSAKGEWIALQDSDDEWFLDKLEKQVKILEKENFDPYLVIHSDAILKDVENNTTRLFKIPYTSGNDVYKQLLLKSGPFFQSMLTSKKAFEEIGYLDESVPSYQEWDTSIRLSKICRFLQMDEPSFIYYYHPGETISKDLKKDIDGRAFIVQKYKNEILKAGGAKMWKKHMVWLCNKCIEQKLYDKAEYFLSEMPFSTKKIKLYFKITSLKRKEQNDKTNYS